MFCPVTTHASTNHNLSSDRAFMMWQHGPRQTRRKHKRVVRKPARSTLLAEPPQPSLRPFEHVVIDDVEAKKEQKHDKAAQQVAITAGEAIVPAVTMSAHDHFYAARDLSRAMLRDIINLIKDGKGRDAIYRNFERIVWHLSHIQAGFFNPKYMQEANTNFKEACVGGGWYAKVKQERREDDQPPPLHTRWADLQHFYQQAWLEFDAHRRLLFHVYETFHQLVFDYWIHQTIYQTATGDARHVYRRVLRWIAKHNMSQHDYQVVLNTSMRKLCALAFKLEKTYGICNWWWDFYCLQDQLTRICDDSDMDACAPY